ncbi:MAG: hypothetical protein RL701_8145 [Pseudomonadota bacterium]|jgi:hypothetical protein
MRLRYTLRRMTRPIEGLKSEALRAALQSALQQPKGPAFAQLQALLAKYGGLPSPHPNLKLAAAFGAEIASAKGAALAVLTQLADDVAAPDTAQAFLPVAAAHGFTQRIRAGFEVEEGFAALQRLAADERGIVRTGVLDALITLAARAGMADELVNRADQWLDDADRELSYGSVASALAVVGDPRVLPSVHEHTRLLEVLTHTIDVVADAPRAASRSEGRRRVFRALAPMLAHMIAALRGSQEVITWFSAECQRAKHPDVRAMLSDALQRLPDVPNTPPRSLIDELRGALEGSQKPVRDHARVRPGSGRGRRSRALR